MLSPAADKSVRCCLKEPHAYNVKCTHSVGTLSCLYIPECWRDGFIVESFPGIHHVLGLTPRKKEVGEGGRKGGKKEEKIKKFPESTAES